MEHHIIQIELLLLVAAVIAMLARRLRVPYTVGLVLAGAALAFAPWTPTLALSKDIIFSLFLPPLVFEAALYIRWQELRKDLAVILTLASAGVALSALVTAAGMHFALGWPWASAAVFGTLIAATDPVSVIANFKEAGVRGRLRLLVEAESLINDSTAAIAFAIALGFAAGHATDAVGIGSTLIVNVGGGIAAGIIVAGAILLIAGRTSDPLVELTLTTVAAYGSFIAAEHFGGSGVLASLTAGLFVGNQGFKGAISAGGQEALESFWEYAAFIANSLIFLLIGLRETQQPVAGLLGPALAGIAFVLAGRAIAIYPLCALFARSRHAVDPRHQHLLFWGGLRGALALALALGLPDSVPHAAEIVTVAFVVVAFSVVVQGITMHPLLKRLGLGERSAHG